MSGHSTPSARSLSHTYGGSPFDASGVSSNPESALDMTGTSPGGRQYFDQPIFEYHTVPELREEDHHQQPQLQQAQQQPQQAHPERRLSGQIPVVGGALRGMRVRTGCNTCRKRHVKCDEQKPHCQNCLKGNRQCVFPSPDSLFRHTRSGSISKTASKSSNASANVNRRSLDMSAGFTIDVKSEPNLSSIASINPDLDVSGMLSLANVAAGHHEGISPTSNPITPNGIANRRHRNQPAVLPLSSTPTFLAQNVPESAQLKPPGSAMISPTGAAVTQFQGLALAPISPAPRSGIPFEATRLDPQGYDRGPDSALSAQLNGSNGISFSIVPREPLTPLPLSEHEAALFKNFVNKICSWLDIFDFEKQFTMTVPRLARRSTGLLKACLALSAKQQYRLLHATDSSVQDPNPEIEYSQYYDAALREMQTSLMNDVDGKFSSSDEFLATAVILSTFEVIDASNQEFKRHLEGVGSIIKPQGIHGDLGGLKGAAFWAWYRQDVWAAFRERRATLINEDYWQLDTSPEGFRVLREDELCNRVCFILGQVINYCAKDEIEKNEIHTSERLRKAEMLEKKLEDWKRCLPECFEPLTKMKDKDGIYDKLWYNPPACGIALQIYSFAKIMLTMHKPHPPSQDRYQHFLAAQRQYKQCSATIIGISLSGCEETYHLLSVQCLYAAGLVLDGKEERKILQGLIRECQNRTGRSTYYLSEELQKIWQEGDSA